MYIITSLFLKEVIHFSNFSLFLLTFFPMNFSYSEVFSISNQEDKVQAIDLSRRVYTSMWAILQHHIE